MHKQLVRLLFSLFMLVLMGAMGSYATGCERPKRLVYSMVPEGDVEQDLARFQPLLKDLSVSLGAPVDVMTPASYGAVIEALIGGSVDIARLGPAAYIVAKGRYSKITPFATFSQQRSAFQEEGAFYYSMLVVLAKKPFRTHDDLRGASLALVDPESASGNKIPRLHFGHVIQQPLQNYFGRISYAGSHQLAAEALLEGRADAAFVSSLHLSYLVDNGKARKRDFRVLWHSAPVPMDPFVFRGDLCSDVKEKIRSAFFRHSEPSKTVLGNMHGIRFLPVDDSDYNLIRSLNEGS